MKSQITQTWLEILTLYSNSLSLRSEFQWSYPALPRTLPSTHFQVPSVFIAPIQTLFLNPEMNFCHEHVNKQPGPKLICCHTGKDIHMVLSWFVSYTTELCCYGLSSISLKYSNISLFYFPSLYFLCQVCLSPTCSSSLSMITRCPPRSMQCWLLSSQVIRLVEM